MRPNAKYLMQHKFVTQVPPAVPSALQPLIQHSQDLITAAALADQNGTLGGSLSRRAMYHGIRCSMHALRHQSSMEQPAPSQDWWLEGLGSLMAMFMDRAE